MIWSEEQRKELFHQAKHAPLAYVRIKALAVWNVASGKSKAEVARLVGASRTSVGEWVKRYRWEGVEGFIVRKGRGRPARARGEDIEHYLRQCPRQFGVDQTRWTLHDLAQRVPSLKGFTESGVYRALVRHGYRYKRGQPYLHSPDPLYTEKKGLWSRPLVRRGRIQRR